MYLKPWALGNGEKSR
jgi:hypothetical protein